MVIEIWPRSWQDFGFGLYRLYWINIFLVLTFSNDIKAVIDKLSLTILYLMQVLITVPDERHVRLVYTIDIGGAACSQVLVLANTYG